MTELKLFTSQIKAIHSDSKHIVMILGRAYGKSYTNALWCITRLINNPHAPGLLAAPIYSQVKETVKYISKHLTDLGIEYVIGKQPKWCKSFHPNHENIISINIKPNIHSWIKIGSADNLDNLRGGSYGWISLDEASYVDESALDILVPCLRGFGTEFNYQIFLSCTPNGASTSWIYKKFIENPPNDSLVIRAPSYENFLEFSKEKIEYFRNSLTERMFKQEIEAECLDFNSNQVFYAFSNNHIKQSERKGRLILSCDQNNIPLVSVVGFVDGQNYFIDSEIVIKENANVNLVATEFNKLYKPNEYKTLYITGDRTGNNRTVVSTSSYYDQLFKVLRSMGYNVVDETLKKNPSQFESAELVNRLFEKCNLIINPTCRQLIAECKKGRWKDDRIEIDKKYCQFDAGDCLRYLIYNIESKKNNKPQGFSLPPRF